MVGETGADMSKFPAAQHLASWAGTTPATTNQPAGDPYLQGALGTAAMSISHTRDTYLAAKYRRIAARRGPLRANVAIERALLVAIWNIATTNTTYRDPGGDYFTRLNPPGARTNAVRQLEAMGYHVTLEEASCPSHSPHRRPSRESSRQVNASHLIALFRAGAVFHEGKLLERPANITAASLVPNQPKLGSPETTSSTGLDNISHPSKGTSILMILQSTMRRAR